MLVDQRCGVQYCNGNSVLDLCHLLVSPWQHLWPIPLPFGAVEESSSVVSPAHRENAGSTARMNVSYNPVDHLLVETQGKTKTFRSSPLSEGLRANPGTRIKSERVQLDRRLHQIPSALGDVGVSVVGLVFESTQSVSRTRFCRELPGIHRRLPIHTAG